MTFRPLFFLPRPALRWAHNQAYAEKLMKHWVVRAIFCTIDKYGIWFPYKGDEVMWKWPWRRKHDPRPFVSLVFSGNGEFGDAAFWSLREIDDMNQMYDEACKSSLQRIRNEIDKKCVEILTAGEPLNAGDLVALDDFSNLMVKHVEHESSSHIGS